MLKKIQRLLDLNNFGDQHRRPTPQDRKGIFLSTVQSFRTMGFNFRKLDFKNKALTLLGVLAIAKLCLAPNQTGEFSTPPGFDEPAVEQAQRLLRKVYPTGSVAHELASLDETFAQNVGNPCQISRDQLRQYANKQGISEWEIGGSIDNPVSSVTDVNGNTTYAKYFVIHDTSYPRYKKEIPSNINEESWEWNNLTSYWNSPVCHLYVNRVGRSKTITPFDGGVMATKMERYILGDASSRGLYLHIELIQPRSPAKGHGKNNDVCSPTPGFSDPQYQRLALLYITASVRKGEWLIPGFHACIDHGIRNAHDDPQGFELQKFLDAITMIKKDMVGV